jgi:hypothetical protein
MKTITCLLIVLLYLPLAAQDPAIQWQNTIGGDNEDVALAIDITQDGGSIIAGASLSGATGDKDEASQGGYDIWIVKLDVNGVLEWQETIGGSGDDYASSIQQTEDGGYIVGGNSDSDISGDKTENSRGGLDLWILKLDNNGTIEWQRTLGGNAQEFDSRATQTTDGGYFVTGYSDSGISGDKTDPSNGQRDFWALKLDSAGNILWQNGIGGSLVERPITSMQLADGTYIMGGNSFSNISGDKTENSQGESDYWLVRLDANGEIIWDSTIGGSSNEIIREIIQTSDNNLVIAGYSRSNAGGDKEEDSNGAEDYWIVKVGLDDGEPIWQNTIGGSGIDFLTNIRELPSGEFIASGYSQSNISGDKTDDTNGGYDLWILKLSDLGVLLSQVTLGGTADETRAFQEILDNGDYIIACTSDSNASGDKTENSEGIEDYWVFKTSAQVLAIPQPALLSNIVVTPNPTKGNITIELPKMYARLGITVRDALGKTILFEYFDDTSRISLEVLGAAGLYFITISDGISSETVRIIKE